MLGKTHSLWSRKVTITDYSKLNHLKVAVKIFDFLIINDKVMKRNEIDNKNNNSNNNNNNSKKENDSMKILKTSENGNSRFGGSFSLFSIIGLSSVETEIKENNNNNNNDNDKNDDNRNRIKNNENNNLSYFSRDEKLSEISLQYAVCLAELGEIKSAVKYVRATIESNNDLYCNSQLFHLLSLLTSSTGDDVEVRRMFVA